jgi:cytochrome c5
VRGYLAVAVGRSARAEASGGIFAREIEGQEIYLPGVTVFLENLRTNQRSDNGKTDLSGRFTVRVPGEGQYRLCWKSNVYGDGCLKDSFQAGREALFLSTVAIRLAQKADFVASFGKVRFADDSIPRTLEPLDDINSFAVVSLIDSKKDLLAQVAVNNFGDYLLPYVPRKDRVELVTRIEQAESVQTMQLDAFRRSPALVQHHLTIDNTPPRLDAIIPVSDSTGERLQTAIPGESVKLEATAHDRDGDALEIHWSTSAEGGTLSANTGNATQWKLPGKPGRYSVQAIVSDKKGGYDRFTVTLPVGAPGVAFSGVVAGTDGKLLDGADVEINGKPAKTDNQGRFLTYVPSADRYILNIRMSGYGFYSKIYDRSVAGGRWTLVKATTSTFPPNSPIVIQDKRDNKNCPGPETERIDWKKNSALKQQVWWQDGKGNNVPPPFVDKADPYNKGDRYTKASWLAPWRDRPQSYGCGPGMGLTIPANALETESGGAPTGQVEVTISTVDLNTPEQMPGDDGVKRPGGDIGWMQSYGAGSVELRDSAGQRLRLKAGSEADVTIPVDRSQLAVGAPIPNELPLLFYDEQQGFWQEEGTLKADAAKKNYVAKVKHLSSLNTDVVFTNPSCVRVESTLSTPYELEILIPMPGGAAPKIKRTTITDAPPHVIYHLPNLTNITITAIAPGSGSTPPRTLGVFVVNTGGAQSSPGAPPPPSACSTTVTLNNAQDFHPTSAQFLHGLFSFEATAISEADNTNPTAPLNIATNNYYAQIDPPSTGHPNGERSTFTDFRTKNGFTHPPGFQLCVGATPCDNPDDEINVAYANSGDLGFGRDMHCRRTNTADGFDYACYVTNFGDIGTDDALDADSARNDTPGAANATVAMEFSRLSAADALNDRHVKFYVFVGENRVNNANLDGFGRRPVPQLCMVCHGGAYPGGGNTGVPGFTTADEVKLGSRFIPFDLRFFTFPATLDKTAQQSAMKHLNEDIVRNAPAGVDAIGEVVTAMYAGSSNQLEDFLVPGWVQTTLPNTAAQETYYKRVVSNACRTCHNSQPFANASLERAGVDLQFRSARNFLRSQTIGTGPGTFSPFSAAEQRVCDEHVMPHALRTHDIFWGQYWQNSFGAFNPTISGEFQAFGDTIKALPTPSGWPATETWPPVWNGNRCGDFTGGGSTPPSFYSTFVHPLWSRNYGTGAPNGCATGGCHSNLSGNATDSRAALLDPTGLFGGSTSAVVIPNDAANSRVHKKLTGTTAGTRMPFGCPTASRRCLNEVGGVYNPLTDLDPTSLTQEVDRIRFWINTGATP